MTQILTRALSAITLMLLAISTALSAANRPAWAPDDNDTLLQAGIAVHSFGVSPDSGDANANSEHSVLRLYNTMDRGYESGLRPVYDGNTYSHPDWTLETIGNVYGIAIDKKRNIYVSSSANWSSGYIGTGNGDGTVPVSFGALGGGDNNNSAGVVYQLDAVDGHAKVWTRLPQADVQITSQVCEGNANDITRQAGPGLGNVVYDIFHNQMFVSNFSDGAIYRLNMQGEVLDSFEAGFGLKTDHKTVIAPYGMTISNDGSKLYYGTMETNMHPRLYAIKLSKDGSFEGSPIDQKAELGTNIQYTQNIGGNAVNDGVWAAYSDLDFTPDGNLLVGVRVGCNGNFATSYNHGGVVYMLIPDANGLYNQPADKVPGSGTSYTGEPIGDNDQSERSGWWYDEGAETNYYNYDAGAIPLRPHNEGQKEEESLQYGPDDGYGGVAVWQTATGSNDYDIYATSGDIVNGEGVHGFMQFSGDFQLKNVSKTIKEVIGYKSVESSTTEDRNLYDYKGIGGDVEVLSVVPVSIGSYAWIDDGDGVQDSTDVCLDGATVTLHREDNMSAKVIDLSGAEVAEQTTHNCGRYHFDNLPEGNYRVCIVPPDSDTVHYEPTAHQNGADNNDTEWDSNIKEEIGGEYCSGMFTLVANSEPSESTDERGDDADNAHESWGNMTVDFGFVKKEFDLRIAKALTDDQRIYHPGDDVNFTITVTNEGSLDATDVAIRDMVPEGLELLDPADAHIALGAIAAGQSTSVVIPLHIADDYEGASLKNCTQIAAASNALRLSDIDSTPDNNRTDEDDDDCAVVPVAQTFDLALVKTLKGSKEVYKPGESVTFVIGIKNQGTLTATDIQIQDMIPDGLELSDEAWSEAGGVATLKDPIDTLAPGATVAREITFVIAEDFAGTTITNIAEIQSASNALGLSDIDSTPNDNPCDADMEHNNDIDSDAANAGGCDDVDPAWLTVERPQEVGAGTEDKNESKKTSPDEKADLIHKDQDSINPMETTDTNSSCVCKEVATNKADALNLLTAALFVLLTLGMGIVLMRTEHILEQG